MLKKLRLLFFAFIMLLQFGYAQQDDIWSLRECIDYALENNLTIKQSELTLKTSEVNLKESRAARLPNLNGSMGLSLNQGRSIDPFTNDFTTNAVTSSDVGISSNVTLFNGLQTYNTIKQNELNLRASELDLEQSKQDMVLNVTLAYLNIIFNDELLASAEAQVAATRKQRDRTAKLVEAGTLAQNSLFEIESQIATEELNVVNARNTLEVSHLTLMQLLQLEPTQSFGIERPDLNDPALSPPSVQLAELYKAAEASQPFIRSADLSIQSAQYGEKIARGNYLPTLSLRANIFTGYSSLTQRTTGEFTERIFEDEVIVSGVPGIDQSFPLILSSSSMVPITEKSPYFYQLDANLRQVFSLGLSIPIYNRRQIKSAVERSQIATARAENQAMIQRQTLNQTIQQSYVDVKNALSTYRQTEKQIDALELTFNNSQRQFDLGVINSVDYLIAKTNLDRAKFDLIRAKFNYIFRTKILDFYQGKPIGL